jgi:hypothetical protein
MRRFRTTLDCTLRKGMVATARTIGMWRSLKLLDLKNRNFQEPLLLEMTKFRP